MSGLFSAKSRIPKTAPEASSLRITTASYGRALPIGWGQFKVAVFILDYSDFVAIAHEEQSSTGGKGGSGSTTSVTYTYQAAVICGICDGVINSVNKLWKGKDYFAASAASTQTLSKSEGAVVPASPYQVTVSPPATIIATLGLTAWSQRWDVSPVFFIEGVDYTRSGSVYTFTPFFEDANVTITYSYSQTSAPVSPLGQANLTLFKGTYTQAAWSWMVSQHPERALGYPGISYVASSAYSLGSSTDFPNTSVEVDSVFGYSSTIRDANPKDVLVDFLTNPYYGAYFTTNGLGDWTSYSDYCVASGLFLSPCYTEQEAAYQIITRILAITNSDIVLGDRKMKIVPYADQAVTGNGKTFTPNLTAIYDLTEDHFGPNGNGGPIRIKRKNPTERYNNIKVKFRNRAKQYNDDVWDAKDEAEIGRNGLRPAPTEQDTPEIKDAGVAVTVGNLLLQRIINVANTYTFKLPFNFACLEAMDLVTLTYKPLRTGLNQALVRIQQITEQDDGWLVIEAEEVPIGHASSILYPFSTAFGYTVNFNATPQSVQAPFIFEAPLEEAGETGLALWAAVTAQASDALWGGANVWVSYDGTSYKRMGTVNGGARYGTLTGTITPSSSIPVALVGKGGQLLSGAAGDAANRATLCYIENSGAGEFFSYQTATFVSTNAYTLSSNVRGQLSTPAAAAASGSKFARCDSSIFKGAALPLDQIGKTLYFKFTSFNIYLSGEQSLADVPAYTYLVRGNIASIPPSPPTGLGYTLEDFGVRVTCARNPESDVVAYHWKLGAVFATAVDLDTRGGTREDVRVQAIGSYTVWVTAVDRLGYESTPTPLAVTIAQAPAPQALSAVIAGENLDLTWAPPASFSAQVIGYEIRYGGSDFASATYASRTQTLTYRRKVDWLGSRTWRVAAIVAPSNLGVESSIPVTITQPGVPSAVRSQVVDNNVMLFWSAPVTGSLPVDTYKVRQGVSWAAGAPLGDNGNSTFTAIINQASGAYLYWIRGYDSAGNEGDVTSVAAQVAQPPDYVLRVDYTSDFGGTKSGTYIELGKLYGPSRGETWQQHFVNQGWTTVQDQITAGYPLYFEPSATTAYYEELFDYGTALPSTTILVSLTAADIVGSTAVSVQISYKKLSGDAWTDAPVGFSVLASDFQYVKIRITLTAAGGNDLWECSVFNVKLSSKLKTDAGTVAATSTDSGGTVVTFNIPFVDVAAITVTALGTTPCFAIYDFVDAPNPTSFKVLVFDKDGNRISKTCSWNVRGY